MTTEPLAPVQPVEVPAEAPEVAAPVKADAAAVEAKRKEWAEKGRELAFLKATGKDDEAAALEKAMPPKPGEEPDAGDKGDEHPQEVSEATADKPAPKADESPKETPEHREALVIARRALERDGWDADDIAALKPERLLAMGEKRRKVQADQDALGRKVAALKKPKTDDAETREPASERTRDLDDILNELEGGETAETRKTAEDAEPNARTRELEAKLAARDADLLRTRVGAVERELLNEFPGLKDPGNRQAVILKMAKLDPRGECAESEPELAKLMREAAYIVFGPELKQKNEQSRRERAERTRSVVDGQPDLESRPAVNPRKLTHDQIRKAAFEASKSGDPVIADQKFQELTGRATKRR